jgi:D-alanyl-D-alanine carboxypeptidase
MTRHVAACLGLLAILAPGCGGNGTAEGPASGSGPRLTPRAARTLDAELRESFAVSGVPGVSAAIVFPDGREWSGASGAAVLEAKQPMTARTSLPVDSVTKLATAALALRLAERGRLRLDDPIGRWYPRWRGDPRATVRDLLGHTAGTRDPGDRFFRRIIGHPRAPATPRMLIAASRPPGPRTREATYSNTGFAIAGLILQSAAKEPVAAAMRRELFRHPGGDGLAFQPSEHAHAPRAHAYWYPSGGGDPVDASDGGPLLPFRSYAGAAGTAGALAGDVSSLARWAHELFAGHILEPASLREMTRFHAGFAQGYGLGLVRDSIDGHTMWGHPGDGLGSHTELWHLPQEKLTIAVAWNDDLLDGEAPFLPALARAALAAR